MWLGRLRRISRHSCIGSSCGGMNAWQALHSRSASIFAFAGTYTMLAACGMPAASPSATAITAVARRTTASETRKIGYDITLLHRRAGAPEDGIAIAGEPLVHLLRVGEPIGRLGNRHRRDGFMRPSHSLGLGVG